MASEAAEARLVRAVQRPRQLEEVLVDFWFNHFNVYQGKGLIIVLLRGAVDGLNVAAPYVDAAYFRARPDIALAKPGTDGGALDLDGHFGLHPALPP